MIRLSKKEYWNRLCNDFYGDLWENGYKIAVKILNNFTPYDLSDKDKEKKNIFKNNGKTFSMLKQRSSMF